MVVVVAVPLTLTIMGGTLRMMDQQLASATALPLSAAPNLDAPGGRGRRDERFFALPRCRTRAAATEGPQPSGEKLSRHRRSTNAGRSGPWPTSGDHA